jgi:hypothetical protein
VLDAVIFVSVSDSVGFAKRCALGAMVNLVVMAEAHLGGQRGMVMGARRFGPRFREALEAFEVGDLTISR